MKREGCSVVNLVVVSSQFVVSFVPYRGNVVVIRGKPLNE
jgi:hypothetical protein